MFHLTRFSKQSLIVVLFLISGVLSQGQNEACVNPAGESGICVSLRECQPLMDIYSRPLITPTESAFIQNSRCSSVGEKALLCCAGLIATGTRGSAKAVLLKPPQCGKDLSNRLVGGQVTELDEYPWTAVIKYRRPDGKSRFSCGGSLINSRYVLTAGHCIKLISPGWEVVGVRLGEYNLTSDAPDCKDDVCADAPVDVGVDKIIVHENYDPLVKAQYNDIALIRMNRNVSFTTYIEPICLPVDEPERSRNNEGTKAYAAGWGRTETDKPSDVKMKVQLDIVNFNRCANVYRTGKIVLRDTQLCAGGKHGKDTCSGDSGGPLMRRIKSNHFLLGVVSFGPKKCGTKDLPGIYTKVAKYIDWIEINME